MLQQGISSKLSFTLLLTLSIAACSPKYETGDYQKLLARNITFNGIQYDIVSINPKELEIRLYWKDTSGNPFENFGSLKNYLEDQKKELIFAANAGIYTSDYKPGGLHIEEGEMISDINQSKGIGNFHMMPNGIFWISNSGAQILSTEDYIKAGEHARIATQSGPMLVIGGQIHPEFTKGSKNLHVRSGVGIDSSGVVHFAISGEVVSFLEFAELFREELNCPNALYLDGKISRFYVPKLSLENTSGDFVGIFAVSRDQ